MNKKQITFLLAFYLLIIQTNNNYVTNGTSIERDYWPTDDWQSASFEDVGMNEQRINSMFEYIHENNYNTIVF